MTPTSLPRSHLREAARVQLRGDVASAVRAGALGEPLAASERMEGAAANRVFEAFFGIHGEVFRDTRRRRTLRCEIGGKGYFAKLHLGTGWREIFASLAALKWPVTSARNEVQACRTLTAHGVRVPGVAAFGARGVNPATRQSFVLLDALDGFVSLEDVGNDWSEQPPSSSLKRQAVTAVATLARCLHAAGICHRDLYLAHLLADAAQLAGGDVELAVIDLHRAVCRRRLTKRDRIRDLAALLYSTALPLGTADRARFASCYGPHADSFWAAVDARAARLHLRASARGLAAGTGALTDGARGAVSIGSLRDLGRSPPMPFRFDAALTFEQDAPALTLNAAGCSTRRIVCAELLRVQPGRRIVVRADVGGADEVVVKAFVGRHAKRDCRRERRGHAALAVGVPVAPLRASGFGAGAQLLAFGVVPGRTPQPEDIDGVLTVLAQMHARHVRQRDLHLGNFLIEYGRPAAGDQPGLMTPNVVAIDGGGVRPGRVGRRTALKDVARLLADANVVNGERHFERYADARGWTLSAHDMTHCACLLAAARRHRARRYAAKAGRSCTAFRVTANADQRVLLARDDDDPALATIIADPERAMQASVPLKQGRTATVMRNGNFVIKRYNVKNAWHGWRMRLREFRGRRAWRVGHALRLVGIPTPRPRALIERHRPRAGQAAGYLIADYAQGESIAPPGSAAQTTEAIGRAPPRFQTGGAKVSLTANASVATSGRWGMSSPASDVTALEAATRRLFDNLRHLRLSHGDMKATNFVLADGELHVLDLDAATFHRARWRFRHRHRRDLQRFLRNFSAQSPAHAAIRQALSKAMGG